MIEVQNSLYFISVKKLHFPISTILFFHNIHSVDLQCKENWIRNNRNDLIITFPESHDLCLG